MSSSQTPPPALYETARQLAAREAGEGVGLPFHRVVASFRTALESLVGPNGADAMVYRAIFLARRELGLVNFGGDAASKRLPEGANDAPESALFMEQVVAHLLWLVIEFIGEELTASFVQQLWPDFDMRAVGGKEESTE